MTQIDFLADMKLGREEHEDRTRGQNTRTEHEDITRRQNTKTEQTMSPPSTWRYYIQHHCEYIHYFESSIVLLWHHAKLRLDTGVRPSARTSLQYLKSLNYQQTHPCHLLDALSAKQNHFSPLLRYVYHTSIWGLPALHSPSITRRFRYSLFRDRRASKVSAVR